MKDINLTTREIESLEWISARAGTHGAVVRVTPKKGANLSGDDLEGLKTTDKGLKRDRNDLDMIIIDEGGL